LEPSVILLPWALAISTEAITTPTLDHTTIGTTDGATILFILHSHTALIMDTDTIPISTVDIMVDATTIHTDMAIVTTTITRTTVNLDKLIVETEIHLHSDTMEQAAADRPMVEDRQTEVIRTDTTNQTLEEEQVHLEQEAIAQRLIETVELVLTHLQPTADQTDLLADIPTTM
tara:strand:+ start:84733 stop:85254 length:522 start_codon:yes stop_codon:yes gene_type:complete